MRVGEEWSVCVCVCGVCVNEERGGDIRGREREIDERTVLGA